jgi:transcriptional regulator with GAF, ATPase, and Fis domain
VDVRVLVATHRDLVREVEEKRFRQDLYYRLAIVPIKVPPLRERLQDVPELADYLLNQIVSELKAPGAGFIRMHLHSSSPITTREISAS